jgi:hypothetical protein
MNPATKWIALLLGVAVVVSALVLWLRPGTAAHPVARITLDGAVVQEIDLDQVVQPYTFQLEGEGGGTNTILVEPGRIGVSEASCPDQICVRQGMISDGTVPVVCLPNKLVITITGGGEALDAATG